jgi:hypothetical protein
MTVLHRRLRAGKKGIFLIRSVAWDRGPIHSWPPWVVTGAAGPGRARQTSANQGIIFHYSFSVPIIFIIYSIFPSILSCLIIFIFLKSFSSPLLFMAK